MVIESWLRTFVEVGEALMEIRDARLYREGFGSFEDYCRERWSFSRVQAHRLIEASEVAAVLPMGNTTNERQMRELAPLKGTLMVVVRCCSASAWSLTERPPGHRRGGAVMLRCSATTSRAA